LEHGGSLFFFLAIWGPNRKISNAKLLRKKRSIDLGRFGTHPRNINVSKMHLKNRVPSILLTAPLTEVVPICTISQAIEG